MSVFENFTKKVGETARAAAKKSGDLVEVTKLNMNIGAEEDKIRKTYADIGKLIYEAFGRGEEIPESLKEYCERIDSFEKNIEELKLKIMELKSMKMCASCGAELELQVSFCPKCGAKQEG